VIARASLALLLAFAGCKQHGSSGDCVDDGDCAEGQACVNKACQVVDCVSTADCGIEQYCAKADHTCVDGCEGDEDCPAGDSCDVGAHSCVPYGCRETQLDCDYGEVCNQDTHVCEKAQGPYCKTCDPFSAGGCGQHGTCYVIDYYYDAYCFVDCNPDLGSDACPRGYECQDATGLGDNVCFADCTFINGQ